MMRRNHIRSLPAVIGGIILLFSFQNCTNNSSESFSMSSNVDGSVGTSALTRTKTSVSRSPACPEGWICPSTPIFRSQIGAWYEPWWSRVKNPLPDSYWRGWLDSSRYMPIVNGEGLYYDAGDPATIRSQFKSIKGAGIDYLILDNTNKIIDKHGNNLKPWIQNNIVSMFSVSAHLPPAEQVPMAVAIGGQFMLNDGETSENILAMQKREVDFVHTHFAAWDKVYFKWDGRPLLVNYNTYSTGSALFPTWVDDTGRFNVRNAADFVNKAHQHYWNKGVFNHGWWGWTQEYPQPGHAEAMVVMPGADNTHRNNSGAGFNAICMGCSDTVEREGGALYMKQWVNAIKHNPRTIIISSWNEFSDETAIETAWPSRDIKDMWRDHLGNATPDWYVQITKAYTSLRKGLAHQGYYRDERSSQIYQVLNKRLICKSAPGANRPVIPLPTGLLKSLGAPACP